MSDEPPEAKGEGEGVGKNLSTKVSHAITSGGDGSPDGCNHA